MSHLHTGPDEHDATVSGFLILTNGPEPRILLHKHKKLDKWLQFGGHVEWHENPWQALAHEFEEESGYKLSQLQVLQPPDTLTKLSGVTLHPYPALLFTHKFPGIDHYHSDTTYALVTDQEPVGTPHDGESSDLKAFTRAEIVALPPEEMYDNCREICLYVLDTCYKKWKPTESPKA